MRLFRRKAAAKSRRTIRKPPSGCGILLAIAMASCTLLALNGFLVAGVFATMGDRLPTAMRHPKILQAIVFIAPVVLLAIEWRLTQGLLRIVDRWLHHRDPEAR